MRYAGEESRFGIDAIGRYATMGLPANRFAETILAAEEPVEADPPATPAEAPQATPVPQIAVVPVADTQPSKEDRAEGSALEPAEASRALAEPEGKLEAEVAKSARSLEEEREKAAGLALEAVTARKELAAITQQHRQALEAERARGTVLARESCDRAAGKREAGSAIEGKRRSRTAKAGRGGDQRAIARRRARKSPPLSGGRRPPHARSSAQAPGSMGRPSKRSARGAALARDLAAVLQENEKHTVLFKARDEIAQLKQAEAAQSARSFEQARDKAAALVLELAAARKELAAGAEQHRQALEEERAGRRRWPASLPPRSRKTRSRRRY